MPSLPPRPEPPRRSDPSPRGSLLPLGASLLAASLGMGLLVFLSLGAFGNVLLLAFALFAFGAVQYLLWGWWLGPWLRRQAGPDEQEAERDFWSRPGS